MPIALGRALFKIALGMIAYAQGHEEACSAKYDLAREFIRKDTGFPNNLIIKTEGKPHPQVQVSYHKLPEGTPFIIDIYGIIFMLNIEPQPVIQLNEAINEKHFTIFSLHG